MAAGGLKDYDVSLSNEINNYEKIKKHKIVQQEH